MRWSRISVILVLLLAACSVSAQDDAANTRRNAIVRAIERAAPAVVSVNVVQVQRQRVRDPFFHDFFELFDVPGFRMRVRERRLDAVGSGFIFDSKGYILTNYHVIEGADRIVSVTLPDGRELSVEYVGDDETSDIAVLKAEGENLPVAVLGSSSGLMVGEWVISIGNPFGPYMDDPQPSVSVGIVSANHRRTRISPAQSKRYYQDMIQTDAAINPGNSGGPLVNALGEVVGINTMIFSESGGSIGLGFAIPIDRVRRVADEIVRYGRRRNPWPGFSVEDVAALSPALQQRLGIAAGSGAVVVSIDSNAPAYKAGLRPGDVVTRANGQTVNGGSDLDYVVMGLFVGEELTLDVKRDGKSLTIRLPIKELR